MIARIVLTLLLAFTGTVGHAQDANTDSREQELDFARQKYSMAVWAVRYAEKPCTGLNKAQYEAARLAIAHYGNILDKAGEDGRRIAFNQMTFARVNGSSCSQLLQSEDLRSQINGVGMLTDELLLAVHFSDVESCGIHGAGRWAALTKLAGQVVPIVKARPDFASVETAARERGSRIATICTSPAFSSSAEALDQTVHGPFLREAVELANTQG